MSAGQYIGGPEAQALIGRWTSIVGAATDNRGNYSVGADIALSRRAPAYPVQRYDGYGGGYGGYGGYEYPPPHRHHRHHHHHHRPWGGQQQQYAYPTYVQGWQQVIGADAGADGFPGFPPRNLLVDAAEPQRAGREVLPMSVDTPILPGQSAQITSRPQRVAFRPERVFISAGPSGEGANAWLVNDIKIGNRSQFSQSGYIPGDMFSTQAIDSFVSFETAQTAMDVVMVVTYVGAASDGSPFYGAMIGTAAV